LPSPQSHTPACRLLFRPRQETFCAGSRTTQPTCRIIDYTYAAPPAEASSSPGWANEFWLDEGKPAELRCSPEPPGTYSVDADGAPLVRALDTAWDRFGSDLPKLAVPTLAVDGVANPIAQIEPVRAYAEQIETLQLKEFPGGHHDILNETVHREVAQTIVAFIGET
jgi:alpha-beta hydrolase superfamily lysophospholipase